jgi:four helix bundle protein
MRRAAASIPANIAEGCGREGDAELARFLRISMGSANELEYHLLLAKDLSYLSTAEYESSRELLFEVKRMQVGLLQRLSAPHRRQQPGDQPAHRTPKLAALSKRTRGVS